MHELLLYGGQLANEIQEGPRGAQRLREVGEVMVFFFGGGGSGPHNAGPGVLKHLFAPSPNLPHYPPPLVRLASAPPSLWQLASTTPGTSGTQATASG